MLRGLARTAAVTGAVALGAAPPARGQTASEIVEAMIEAHGGYESWAEAPTIAFEDLWSNGAGFRTVTQQGSRRAYLDDPRSGASIVWDGRTAWSVNYPDDAAPPKFLYNLNWYFLNLPWVLKDPGVHLGEPQQRTLFHDPTPYFVVRVTFDPGVGTTPDDWYEIYVHPGTWRLQACRYVVTYRALLPEGVKATPPHVLVYEDWDRENGLMVPARFTIYDEDGSVYAGCEISGWSFREPFDESRMEMPEGAVVDGSEP